MINLGIIYGSRTCEHEVSIISALQLIKNANKTKYNVFPIYISQKGEWFTGEALLNMTIYTNFDPDNINGINRIRLDITPGSGALIAQENKRSIFGGIKEFVIVNLDCVIPVLHGMHGEDGTIQGLLEIANIPYSSSNVAACAIGMDKVIMKNFFRGFGFPVIDDVWFYSNEWNNKHKVIKHIENTLNYPVFVKPANLGSSIGVSKANNLKELEDSIELALSFDKKILVEKAVNNPVELNCSVLGDVRGLKSSVIEMPVTGGNVLGFIEKYLDGNNSAKGMVSLKRIVPAPIEEELKLKIQELSIHIFKVINCKGVVRIDFMFDSTNNGLYITEINVIPGSLSYYLWEKSNIKYSELIDSLVDIALYDHSEKQRLNYAFSSNILNNNIVGKLSGKGGKL